MASNTRAGLINKVIKVVKKYYKPTEPPKDRKVLEHLVFACCVENSNHEDAEKVYNTLTAEYFDWNEVRDTIVETGAETIWVTHGREDALVYWCQQQGLAAEPLRIAAYDDDGEGGE